MMPSCEKGDPKQMVVFRIGDMLIAQPRDLRIMMIRSYDKRLVLRFVLCKIIAKLSLLILEDTVRDSQIGLGYGVFAKALGKPRQAFVRLGEHHETRSGTIYAMYRNQKDIPLLVVLLFQIGFDIVRKTLVASLVGLYDFSRFLVYDYDVIIFVN